MTTFTKTIYLESGVVQGDRLLTQDGRSFHISAHECSNFPNKIQLAAPCFHYAAPIEGRSGYIFPGSITELCGEQSTSLKQNHEHTAIGQQSRSRRGDTKIEDVPSLASEDSSLLVNE